LTFYRNEYSIDFESSYITKTQLVRKDTSNRFRTFSVQNNPIKLMIDPVFGTSVGSRANKFVNQYFSGLHLFGYLSSKIGFNIKYRDVTESFDSSNSQQSFSPEQGIINTSRNLNQLNYSNIDFNLSYVWNSGALSLNKQNINWGYGEVGKIVLSNKAPSFINIRLDLNLTKWLSFNYFHGWLNSDIVDSNRSYNTPSGYRNIYIDKFIANHSFTVKLNKKLI